MNYQFEDINIGIDEKEKYDEYIKPKTTMIKRKYSVIYSASFNDKIL